MEPACTRHRNCAHKTRSTTTLILQLRTTGLESSALDDPVSKFVTRACPIRSPEITLRMLGDANRFRPASEHLPPGYASVSRGTRFSNWKPRTMPVSAGSPRNCTNAYLHESMRVDRPVTHPDANSRSTPRTPYGRFLRASMAVDELPQIFNVLCGEMSLVGPRPCTPNEFAHYEVWQRARVNGLPGLTGYWQVNGKNKTTFNEMIVMDLVHLENMSILVDLKIMLEDPAASHRRGSSWNLRRGHNAIGPGANRTKVARGDFPTSVPVTAIRMGLSVSITRLRPRLKTNGMAIDTRVKK